MGARILNRIPANGPPFETDLLLWYHMKYLIVSKHLKLEVTDAFIIYGEEHGRREGTSKFKWYIELEVSKNL